MMKESLAVLDECIKIVDNATSRNDMVRKLKKLRPIIKETHGELFQVYQLQSLVTFRLKLCQAWWVTRGESFLGGPSQQKIDAELDKLAACTVLEVICANEGEDP